MVVTQLSGTKRDDLEAKLSPTLETLTGIFAPGDCQITTGMAGSIAMNPVEYKGESVLLNPQYMNVGQAYSFILSGHSLVVIKRFDETVECYYLDKVRQ